MRQRTTSSEPAHASCARISGTLERPPTLMRRNRNGSVRRRWLPPRSVVIARRIPARRAASTADEPAASEEGLWDPVPVTLPIYVYKEKAPSRTVRTISLPGTEFAALSGFGQTTRAA